MITRLRLLDECVDVCNTAYHAIGKRQAAEASVGYGRIG